MLSAERWPRPRAGFFLSFSHGRRFRSRFAPTGQLLMLALPLFSAPRSRKMLLRHLRRSRYAAADEPPNSFTPPARLYVRQLGH